MAPAAAALLCFLTVGVFGSVSAQDQINIRAEPGQTITLPCDAVSFRPVIVVDWSRTDQNSVNIILLQRGKSGLHILDPSYKGRVELKDRQNGDVSLILENVTTADSGTYECHIQRETNRRKRSAYENKLLSTIHLDVAPPGGHDRQTGGGGNQAGEAGGGGNQAGGAGGGGNQAGGLTAALILLAVALAVVLIVNVAVFRRVILWKKKNSSPPPSPPPDEEAEKPPLIKEEIQNFQ